VSMLFLNSWRVSVVPYYVTTHSPAIQNSIDTQGKLRLNLHSLSVSELLKYRRKSLKVKTMFYIFVPYTFYYPNLVVYIFPF
jgi:hypothetical protein